MDTTLIPEDRQVTVTWTTTSTVEYEHTFTFGELREAVNGERTRYGHRHHPDLTDDIGLLAESWLADYEDEDGSETEFTRELTYTTDISLPVLPVFTVSLDDSDDERECPHTYVLHAPDLQAATALAIARFKETFPAEYPDPDCAPDVLTGTWWTFPGQPSWPKDMSGREWDDLRGDQQLLERAYRAAVAS